MMISLLVNIFVGDSVKENKLYIHSNELSSAVPKFSITHETFFLIFWQTFSVIKKIKILVPLIVSLRGKNLRCRISLASPKNMFLTWSEILWKLQNLILFAKIWYSVTSLSFAPNLLCFCDESVVCTKFEVFRERVRRLGHVYGVSVTSPSFTPSLRFSVPTTSLLFA